MPNALDLAYGLPLGAHYAFHRFATGKYGPRTVEKTGRLPRRDGDAPALWMHAVSLGEAIAGGGLLRAFGERWPDWDIRLSTTTATGRAAAERAVGPERVFYYPLDFSWMVRRTFDRIRPSLVVLMELELWPNFLDEASRRGVPVVVANARITERSERRFARVPALAKRWFGRVDHWLAQTDEYAQRLIRLGALPDRVTVAGSLKYDNIPEIPDERAARGLRALALGDGPGPLIVAGSTHPGEEEALLDAWTRLRGDFPGLRMMVMPRHPERWAGVEALMARFGPVTRRSTLAEGGAAPTDLILGDSTGELAHWFAAADVAFVGGTLIPHGGQNFMEPCGVGVPTVCGSSLFNFAEAAALLRSVEGMVVVPEGGTLSEAFRDVLTNTDEARAMGARARKALLEKRGATGKTLDVLAAWCGAGESPPPR